MAILVAVYTSDGGVGRCDSRCYNAYEPYCECICGGTNHGQGFTIALDNTRRHAQTWIEHADIDLASQQLHQHAAMAPLF